MKAVILTALSLLIWCNAALAQNPPLGIQDEGGTISFPAYIIDCIGAGIACSHSGRTATIQVTGGGGSDTFASIEEDGVAISTGVPTLDFDSTDFTIVESPTDDFDISIKNSGITITESQISDLQSYLTAETNNLESIATSAGDAEIFVGTGVGTGAYITGLAACAADEKIEYVPGSPDTFTCEAITITESDISDLGTYIANPIAANVSFSLTNTYSIGGSGNQASEIWSLFFGSADYFVDTGGRFTFEGDTNNSIETFLVAEDPTSIDKTITLPNATGTVELEGHTHTESEISDLQSYLTAETNDLESVATSANSGEIFVGTGIGTGVYTAKSSINLSDFNDDLTHTTDTNANTFCTGTLTYFDGEGNCDTYTLSGNTASLGTTSGTLTSGNCAQFDASGNIVDSGSACGVGGGGDNVTVNSIAADTTANFLDGNIDFSLVDGGAGGPDNITATLDATYEASLNVATAAALAANGGNCTAGNYPLGVDASGAVESCTVDDDVPESGDFGAGTDLDSDGSVSADSVALTTDTTGNYVSSATASQGLLLTGTEGASLGLQDCAANEILKRNVGDTAWECSADSTGGTPTFTDITTGTNTAATMTVGTGASMTTSGSGTIAATTAAALAANGGNCATGEIPLGVDAAGAVEGCYEPATSDITGVNAGTDLTADLEEETHCSEHSSSDLSCSGETLIYAANSVDDADVAHTITLAGDPALAASQCWPGANGVICEGTTADSFEALLSVPVTASDKTITFQDASYTVIGRTTTDTLTNKSISLGSNTLTATSAQLRTALSDEVGTGAAYFVGGALGTPASGTLTNATGLPVSTGISGLGTGVATFLATPSSANLASALTDETGSGVAVFDTSPTITSPTISTSIALPSSAIDAATEIGNDVVTHAQILDTDQMDSKCLYIEDPTIADDLKSIWFNGTANDFQVTEIWAESDQTVTFMLQLDDGTPADCDTVDLSPTAGTAEDTSLNGDCLVAAGERLDLDLVNVSGTPTWVSICFTGNWVD